MQDAVQKALAFVKQLEESGTPPEEAKRLGMAEMMKLMAQGGEEGSAMPEMSDGEEVEEQEETDTPKDGDIKTMMAIIKAKKAAGGKMAPKLDAPSLDY